MNLMHRPKPQSAGADTALLGAQAISVERDGRPVLRDVTLSIQPGEIVTIVGPNGSGKTTLLRALLGAETVSSGRVVRKRGLRVGYVPQKLFLDPSLPMTVARFLSLPRRTGAAAQSAALQAAGATGLAQRPIAALSGGQTQRVLLARALLDQPEILLLDEPTQGLDQVGAAAFYQMVENLRQQTGCAVLMVSHELHVVMSASDRVICLNGHVCCHGTPEVVAQAEEYRALFGPGTKGTLALYRHQHDHSHDTNQQSLHSHVHGPECCDGDGGADGVGERASDVPAASSAGKDG
jgi:zinc transport system ATP-binding protein